MSRKVLAVLIAVAGCLIGATPALASTTNLSFNPSYSAQPFSFYCDPYKYSFEDGKHYAMATSTFGSNCYFTIPSDITGIEIISIYKGTPGNATFVAGDRVIGGTPSLVQENSVVFGTPAQDQDYFSVVYGSNSNDDNTAFDQALRTGSSTPLAAPSGGYHIIKWKWGAQPPSEFEPVIIIPGILGSWQNTFGTWVLDPITHRE